MNIDRIVELQEQAWELQSKGRPEEAFAACQEALHLLEQSKRGDSPDAANLLNDLSDMEIERQNFRDALALAERARSITDRLGDRFHGETAAHIRGRTLGLLGTLRCTLGDYSRAEADLRQAITTAISEFGAGSSEVAVARNNLGVLFKYWGRFDEGLDLYYQAQRSIPEGSLECARICHNIGGILHAAGKFAAAEEPSKKAWSISCALLGPNDPQTMLDAVAYAAVLDGLERYKESEPIYISALSFFEKLYGSQHYEVSMILNNLAAQFTAREMYSEAEKRYRRALEINEKLFDADCPEIAVTLHNLGSLLLRIGRPAEAASLLQRAVQVFEERLVPEHPTLTIARQHLQRALTAGDQPTPLFTDACTVARAAGTIQEQPEEESIPDNPKRS